MPAVGNILSSVTSAGVGTAVGYIAAAIIQTRSQRESDEDKAGALVTAAATLTDRLLTRNRELSHTNTQLRRALNKLIDAVQLAQDTFEHFPTVGDGKHNREMMEVLHTALDIANAVEL